MIWGENQLFSETSLWQKGCNFLSQLFVIRNPLQVYCEFLHFEQQSVVHWKIVAEKKNRKTWPVFGTPKVVVFHKTKVIYCFFIPASFRNPKKTNLSCDNPAIRRLHPHPPIPGATPPQTLITRSTQIKNCSTGRLQLTQTAGLVGFHRDGVLCGICCFHGLQNF